MIYLVLTLCLVDSCEQSAIDSFTTLAECNEVRQAFINDRKVPVNEAVLLSCEAKQ